MVGDQNFDGEVTRLIRRDRTGPENGDEKKKTEG